MANRRRGSGASYAESAGYVDNLDTSPTHSLTEVLKIKDFRNLSIGCGLSSLGDWLGLLAITSMATTKAGDLGAIFGSQSDYQLKNYAISGVLFFRIIPALILGPLAGYVADRFDRKTTLVVGDVLRGLLFLSMPIVGTLWWVFAATILIEAVSVVWGPTKDATVPNLVPPHRLEAANQLNLILSYATALPAAILFSLLALLASGLHFVTGIFSASAVDLALSFNAFSFLLSGLIIARMKSIPKGPATLDTSDGVFKVIIEGWKYVGTTPVARGLVIGILGAFAAGGVISGLAPTFVADLGGGDPGYGLMFGAVFAGLGLGMWRGPRWLQGLSRRRVFGLALTVAGLLLITLSLNQFLYLSIIITLFTGFFAGVAWVTGNTMLGLEVPNEQRGRTLALVGTLIRLTLSVVLAVAPLIAGLIGTHAISVADTKLVYNGAAWTFLLAGLAMSAVGVMSFRQMDDRKGISLRKDLRDAFRSSPGMYTEKGLFIAFEGGEGAGKSTQVKLLADWLKQQGYQVVLTRQPGDTNVGKELREIVLNPATGKLADRTEALLYAADKAEHVEQVVAPALASGKVVITDRYVDSTLAYQGAGRALDVFSLERVVRWATGDLRPHLTILLDLEPAAGFARFTERDRIEAEPVEFHQRVRDAFLRLATARPERYLVISATQSKQTIAAEIQDRVGPLLVQAEKSK